jgi:hypothetical protein
MHPFALLSSFCHFYACPFDVQFRPFFEKAEAKRLEKENDWEKIHALSYLRTKYESENRTEEAAIISKLIHEEEADEIREYHGN